MNPVIADIRSFFLRGSMLSRLLAINISLFVVVNLIRLFFFLMNVHGIEAIMLQWLGVPSSVSMLVLRPWTAITYMFMHFDFLHIFFNMFMLYVGGRLFIDYLGSNRLSGTYVLGGLFGAVFFIVAYNIFPVFATVKSSAAAIGASASVLAIFVAIATYMPNHRLYLIIFGPIRLKYIALIFILVDLLSITRGNAGGHIAHLGGALWGYSSIVLMRRGWDPGKSLSAWIDALGKLFRPRPKLRVEYRNTRPLSDEEYNKRRVQNQKRMDEILDKISKSGYESLSAEEKQILFNLSNQQ